MMIIGDVNCYLMMLLLMIVPITLNYKIMQISKFNYDPKWQAVKFEPPAKAIILFDDVPAYQKSKIHDDYIDFLIKLQNSIKSKKISETTPHQKFMIFDPFFNKLEGFLNDAPPIQQPMRYGNKAFKDWHILASDETSRFLDQILPEPIKGAKAQLFCYIVQSFGSNVRIDYGTGHEMSFMYFCWALFRLGFCGEDEFEWLTRMVFYKYINLMRKVQMAYMLEPAGSHGVWGLDDYHFLPFLLGAAEIIGSQELASPECIHNPLVVQRNAKEYMYMNCVKFIMEVKKGVSFGESSPVLNNISGAANWEKIAGGMIKMYKVEVLGKHPVIKHQYFGTIIPYK